MNKVRLDSYVPDANKKRKMESEYDLSLEVKQINLFGSKINFY